MDSQSVIDTRECIFALMSGAPSVDEVLTRIETLFADTDSANIIMLSSTHRAKGLERDRVFVLADTFMQASKRRSNVNVVEEENLWYVAISRAKRELVLVRGEVAA